LRVKLLKSFFCEFGWVFLLRSALKWSLIIRITSIFKCFSSAWFKHCHIIADCWDLRSYPHLSHLVWSLLFVPRVITYGGVYVSNGVVSSSTSWRADFIRKADLISVLSFSSFSFPMIFGISVIFCLYLSYLILDRRSFLLDFSFPKQIIILNGTFFN
jgi:hypothetical protein